MEVDKKFLIKALFKEPAYITQEYNYFAGLKFYPYWLGFHKGIDFGTHRQVVSNYNPFPAYVDLKFAGFKNGWGNIVEYYFGGFYWQHAHLHGYNFTDEKQIEPCGEIGLTGNTGTSSGIHLHWGCYKIIAGVKIYYNPFIIYQKIMQDLFNRVDQLEEKLRYAVAPLVQMKDGSFRLVRQNPPQYAKVPTEISGAMSLGLLYRVKGQGQKDESEFKNFTEVPFKKF